MVDELLLIPVNIFKLIFFKLIKTRKRFVYDFNWIVVTENSKLLFANSQNETLYVGTFELQLLHHEISYHSESDWEWRPHATDSSVSLENKGSCFVFLHKICQIRIHLIQASFLAIEKNLCDDLCLVLDADVWIIFSRRDENRTLLKKMKIETFKRL